MRSEMIEAYVGEEPFVFVSYAHKDSEEVLKEIRFLKDSGFRVWYDEGISPGGEWAMEIARALSACDYFISFISPNSITSKYCRKEMGFALNRDIPFLAIHIVPTELPIELEFQLGDIQAVFRHELPEEKYREKLLKALPAQTKFSTVEIEVKEKKAASGNRADHTELRQWIKGIDNPFTLMESQKEKIASYAKWVRENLTPAKRSLVDVRALGIAAFNEQEYQKAIDHFSKHIEMDSKNGMGYFWRGITEFETEQFKESVSDLSRAIEAQPRNGIAFYRRGRTLQSMEKNEASLRDYTKAIELEPEHVNSHYNRGMIYYRLEDFEKSVQDFDWILDKNPADADAYTQRSRAYHQMGKLENALKDAQKAAELDPENSDAHFMVGTTYYSMGQYENAISIYEKVCEMNPGDNHTLYNMGLAYKNIGENLHDDAKLDSAMEYFDRVLMIDPDYSICHYQKGSIEKFRENYDLALQHYAEFEAADDQDGIEFNLYYDRGYIYYRTDENDKAIEDFTKALSYIPESGYSYYYLAYCYYEKEDYDSALRAAHKACEYQPDDPDCFKIREMIYQSLGDEAAAAADHQRIEELNELQNGLLSQDDINSILSGSGEEATEEVKNEAVDFHNLGVSAFEQQDYQKAVEHFKKAVETHPDHSSSFYSLGLSYFMLEKYSEAKNVLKTALDLGEPEGWPRYLLGRIAAENKDFKEAVQEYEIAYRSFPKDQDLLYHFGYALFFSDRYAESIKYLNQLVVLNADFPGVFFLLGKALYFANREEDALKAFDSAIKRDDNPNYSHYFKGLCYYYLDDGKNSVAEFKIACHLIPDDADCWYNLGRALIKQKEFDEALNRLSKASEIDPDKGAVYFYRGWAFDDKSDFNSAIREYNLAEEKGYTNEYLFHNRGLAYKKQKNIKAAYNDFHKALEVNPEYASAWYQLGNLYVEVGQSADAKTAYQNCLKLDPEHEAAKKALEEL